MTSISLGTIATIEQAYEAAHRQAALVDLSARGLLRLTGQTRLDLINRMSTQAVNALQPGEGAATVLTTDIGRIIDRVIVYAAEDHALVLTGEGHADPLARYFRRNIFFNDDAQVQDLSAGTTILGVYGSQAGQLLRDAGFDVDDLPLHHWRPADAALAAGASLHRADPVAGGGYYLIAPSRQTEGLWQRLAASKLRLIDDDAYDYLRIEAGRPRFGRELTLDYIPLEAGLWDDVSFHKGCYTGQEIIARMESRGKLAKRLVRLRADAPVAAGAEVIANDRPAGTITSAADGPAGTLALGYVKTAVLDANQPLFAVGIPLSRLKDEG